MTRQRLYRQVQGTVDTNGHVQLAFEQVPQGSAWTGSVAMFATPAFGGFPSPSLTNGPLQGAQWWLLRNQSPILQLTGSATAVDVQCVGQESLTVIGYGLTANDTVTAIWSGWSDDLADAVFVEPHPYGVTAPYMSVYNNPTTGPGSPLQVTEVPDPTRVVTVATGFLSVANGQITMFTPGLNAHGVEIWNVACQLTTGQSGTTAQSLPVLATVRLNDGTNVKQLMNIETTVVQASAQQTALSQEFHGMAMQQNQTLELITSNLAAGNTIRANAAVVLSYVPSSP